MESPRKIRLFQHALLVLNQFISRQQSLTRPEAEVIPTSSVSMLTEVEDIAIFSSAYSSEKYLYRVAGL